METKVLTAQEVIAEVSANRDMMEKAQRITRRKLGGFLKDLSEVDDIAADAVQSATLSILERLQNASPDDDLGLTMVNTYGTDECVATRYLYTAVDNYVNTRAKRWGTDENGKPRYRARQSNEIDLTDTPHASVEEWLGSLREVPPKQLDELLIEMDLDRESSGLKDDILDIIAMRGEGLTFQEIADELESTPDAVRMKLKRAKDALQKVFKN